MNLLKDLDQSLYLFLDNRKNDLKIDNREITIYPFEHYNGNEQYPCVIIGKPAVVEYQPMTFDAGYFTYKIEIFISEKSGASAEDDKQSELRLMEIVRKLTTLLRQFDYKYSASVSYSFDAEIEEIGNKVKNNILEINIKSLELCSD
jgi:hypothetical protein